YTAANEFPNLYLVHGVCPETHASGTWFFKYPFQYSARWQDQLVQLTIDPEQETLPAGSEDLHTQIREFRTDDPDYQCMSKLFLEAYHAPQNPNQVVAVFHCLEGNPAPAGIVTFWIPPVTYSAVWRGQEVVLRKVSASVPSAVQGIYPGYVGQVTQFHTSDPVYRCFEDASLRVYVAAVFPGEFLIYDRCPNGVQGAWTFSPKYSYSAVWQGQPVVLSLSVSISSPLLFPDSTIQGYIANFRTDDPAFACFNNTNKILNVYTAPQE